MNNVNDFKRRVSFSFFYITIAVLIFLYTWWFRLNPIVFGPGEQAAAPLIFGLILISVYGFSVGVVKLLYNNCSIKALFFAIAIFFLVTNAVFLFYYFPRLQASARFGETTYYITSNHPFLECCGYFQFTKWESVFHYESNFYIYNMPPVQFIYDKKTDEVSLVDVSDGFERLYETFGKSHRSYEGYAKLVNHLYYSSAKCNRDGYGDCATWTYILYQCNLDNTSCSVLPIEYTTERNGWSSLQANESTKEINFYFESYFPPDEILIYTYGQSPQCFIDGCSIVR